MSKPTMTRHLAQCAAVDAANRQARHAGRVAWNHEDYTLAVQTFDQLYPEEVTTNERPNDSRHHTRVE